MSPNPPPPPSVGDGPTSPPPTLDPAILDSFRENGFAILPGVLSPSQVQRAREALVRAAEKSEARGIPTRMEALDPGGKNVRVYDLIEYDPVFADLVVHTAVLPYLDHLLANDLLISNFTANIALPGSGSMNAHCDQSTVMPEPWTELWSMNAIWCLDDTDEGNGATRYLPESHRYVRLAEVPSRPKADMKPFEATAGSVILMDGRLWHTSGENRSSERQRALLFAFYTRSFLRAQNNWWRSLSRARQKELSPDLLHRLGLDSPNMGYGAYLADPSRRE